MRCSNANLKIEATFVKILTTVLAFYQRSERFEATLDNIPTYKCFFSFFFFVFFPFLNSNSCKKYKRSMIENIYHKL